MPKLNKLSNIQPTKTDIELAKIIKSQNHCGFHALALLSFIGNSDDLDILVEVLCQDPLTILQLIPGGIIHEIIPPLIYKLGESKLDKLTDLIKTNGILYFSHIAIFETILMISYLQPNRKKECIDWFDNAFQFYFNKIENGTKVENDLMDELMQRAIDFNDPKLNNHIKLLFDKYQLDSHYGSDYIDIQNNSYSYSECIDYWQSLTADIYKFYDL